MVMVMVECIDPAVVIKKMSDCCIAIGSDWNSIDSYFLTKGMAAMTWILTQLMIRTLKRTRRRVSVARSTCSVTTNDSCFIVCGDLSVQLQEVVCCSNYDVYGK